MLKFDQSSAPGVASQRFHYISADLRSASEAERVISEATAWNNKSPPDIVICCAGFCHPGYFVDLPASIFQEQMETDYLSAAFIAHASCKAWLSSPRSKEAQQPPLPKHIVFTASVVALYPMIGYSPYAPTKSALRNLSETLSQELQLYQHHTPIKSHCIFPATIFSPGLDNENKYKPDITKKFEEDDTGQSPEEVAAAALKGLERGDENVTVNIISKILRASLLGASTRNGWGVVDALLGWVATIIMLFVRRSHDKGVRAWGVKKQMDLGGEAK